MTLRPIPIPNDWDRRGLPAWTYHSQALFDLERDRAVPDPLADRRPCERHSRARRLADLRHAGRTRAWSCAGRTAWCAPSTTSAAIAARGWSMAPQGHCKGAHRLPVPRLGLQPRRHPARRGPTRDLRRDGPRAVRAETDRAGNLPRLHLPALSARPAARRSPTCWRPMTPISPPTARRTSCRCDAPDWTTELPVNWKSVRDVDNEGYHVALAHPACRIFTAAPTATCTYPDGLSHSIGRFRRHARPALVGAELRQAGRREPDWLPDHLQPRLDLLRPVSRTRSSPSPPKASQFYQDIPVSPGKTRLTGRHLPLAERDPRSSGSRAISPTASTAIPRPRISNCRSGRTNR